MSELPEGWLETTLGDVASWGSGGTPSRANAAFYKGRIPWVKTGELGPRYVFDTSEKISELAVEKSSAKIFPKNSVAIAMYGATIGKTSILGIDAATNQACAVGIPDPELTTKEYLYHYLCSQKEFFIDAGKGGAQPNISQGVIKGWEIPLAPFPEQKRIADKLDTMLARVDATRERMDRIPQILKQFRQSVLAAATSGRLTEGWRNQNYMGGEWRNKIESNRSDLKARRGVAENLVSHGDFIDAWEYPETWWKGTSAKLLVNGVFLDIKDGNHGANHPTVKEFTEKGLPFITAAQVNNFRVDYDGAYKISGKALEKIHVGFSKSGDVVLTHKGSVGRVGLIDRECILTPQTTYYRLNLEFVLPKYLMYFLASAAFSGQIDEIKSQTTRDFVPISAQYGLIHLIPPLGEQKEIVRRVEALFALADKLEARYQQARAQVDKLTPALLAKAFRGELVEQDPNDEPAEKLLERVRAARDDISSTKATRIKRTIKKA